MTDETNFIIGDDRIVAGLNSGNDGYIFIWHIDYLPEKMWGDAARPAYSWKIFDEDMTLIDESLVRDKYVMGPSGGEANILQGLEALLSFLSAAAEAYSVSMRGFESENIDLFPPVVTEWAYQHEDEITMLAIEISEEFDG